MEPRFEVRWANGYWRVFDTWQYTTMEPLQYTEREAVEAVQRANAEWQQRMARR